MARLPHQPGTNGCLPHPLAMDDRYTLRRPARDDVAEHPHWSTYQELKPPAHLRDHVVCFWHSGARDVPGKARVLPDGCVDVIWRGERPPFVAGPATTATVAAIEAATAIIGVRFQPGVAAQVLGISARELVDQDVPLRDLWPRERAQRWQDAVASDALPEKMAAIDAALTVRLSSIAQPDRFIDGATRWLARHPCGTIEEVQRLTGLSERQMRRRFDDAVGYGPKQLQRIMRLQFLLWLASRERIPHPPLVRLAHAAGYSDQPHMTREVRALTGISPRELLLEGTPASAVADLFGR
jgi:AraC-like DNA-binding protein